MKVFKLKIENYRLLKSFSMDLEKELSLVIGKNNTGKTSILSVLDKFLGQSERNKFSFDDFNIDFKKELKAIVEAEEAISEENYKRLGIRLRLFIDYTETDNLSNVSRVMMDLDPDNNVVVLGFEYTIDFTGYSRVRKEYREFEAEEKKKIQAKPDYTIRNVYDFLRLHQTDYFRINKRSLSYDPATKQESDGQSIDLDTEKIKISDIINFKYISAKRDVANKEVDKTLSGQTSRIYRRTETSDGQNKAVEDFKDKLSETDAHLSGIYKTLFDSIVKKVKDFGGVKINESEIEIISTLQHRELLEGNTTVVYKHDADNHLPEHYNGLGYMNLISMIFEIEILVHEFKREKDKRPADINLLFIEEPEAHTHPQMQYVFIKNIKKLIGEGIKREDGEHKELQYIISTHSACIVADSDFNDIKYLKRDKGGGIITKNLKDLKNEYDAETTQYQFLKQYLTISRAEIFFADKAILIEGDTERILVPTLMRKIDIEEEKKFVASGEKDEDLPLLSQNISVVEVGAYSQIFERFIDFLGIKGLIITDLDAVDGDGKKCEVEVGVDYSNAAIRYFFNNPSLDNLKGFGLLNKLFNKVAGVWTNQADGRLCVVYQTKENGYNARSFEDAFININMGYVNDNKDSFRGLQNREHLENDLGAYELADKCIKKKTHFALDIIYHSNEELSNWQVPSYIKEGLLWLKRD
ncbi:ATP-dependent endonuclease [Desulfosarcina alkanivorans]|uniref:ATP-dependent endonuclease n=1 Tax=Desulfosarcina alkanivorans TaxID=571177 RepID=A0A5K7YRS7_9BACT|nr:ATP-dependent endonuclease [Desulfosarcina alkanivorans]BBO71398.1 ATP-dependent endonuclease [Desulfosarcina alkanivorans]